MNGEMLVSRKQLGYCNAYVNTYYKDKARATVYELVSYCTPVCRVTKRGNATKNFVATVELAPAARVSATTTKHVRRFLQAIAGVAGENALSRFYQLVGAGYKYVNYTLVYNDVFHDYKVIKVDDMTSPKQMLWFERTYAPWYDYYNAVGFKVEGMHK